MPTDVRMREVAYCPHCQHPAPQTFLVNSIVKSNASYGDVATVVTCDTCSGLLIYRHDRLRLGKNQLEQGAFYYGLHHRWLLYPKVDEIHRAVPPRIARPYREALKIKRTAPGPFVASIRRCLEMVCKDQGTTKDKLHEMLLELATKNVIPPATIDMSELIRHVGNAASHDDIEIDGEYADAIYGFFEMIINVVYVQPLNAKEVRAKFEHAKRAKRAIVTKVS